MANLRIRRFSHPNKKWRKFVKKGRNGTLNHSYDAVEGPMYRPKGRGGFFYGSGHQLALFSERASELFSRCIKEVECNS